MKSQNTDRASGFTLIELMVVVAIIGVLAALAIGAYGNYTTRAQVTEGLQLAGALKTDVADYYATHGTWPADNAALGLTALGTRGKYVTSTTVSDGTIFIVYGGPSSPDITGATLGLQPALSGDGSNPGNEIIWRCGFSGMPALSHQPGVGTPSADSGVNSSISPKYAPASCRA